MEFQKLLNKLKDFKEGIDFILTSPIVIEDKRYEKVGVYSIISPQLKKQARGLMLNGDVEDGGFCRVGTEIEGKWFEYEKGDNNQPDQFEIKVISSEQREELQRRKEQKKHDREKPENVLNVARQAKEIVIENELEPAIKLIVWVASIKYLKYRKLN